MGRRSATATFLPGTFVFPGGAVDPADQTVSLSAPLAEPYRAALPDPSPAVAALRELTEETGLRFPRPYDLSCLHYVFRAVTPPGLPRRFDTWFFVADAARLAGDIDQFAPEFPELDAIGWHDLASLRSLPMPYITRHVLDRVLAGLPDLAPKGPAPQIGV